MFRLRCVLVLVLSSALTTIAKPELDLDILAAAPSRACALIHADPSIASVEVCAASAAAGACALSGLMEAKDCPDFDRFKQLARSAIRTRIVKSNADSYSVKPTPPPVRAVGEPIAPGPQQIHLAATSTFAVVVVMWVTTAVEKDGRAFWRLQGSNASWSSAAAGWSTYDAGVFGWDGSIHKAFFANLQPSSRYEYFVETSGRHSEIFTFTSSPRDGDGSVVRQFAVVADMGTAIPVGFEVVDFIDRENGPNNDHFSLALHAGDVCYAGTGSTYEFEEIWDAWGDQIQKIAAFMPYQFAVGNHEHYYNYSSYRTRFDMSGDACGGRHNFWYYLPYGNVFFVFMSTEHPYDSGSEQHTFLVKTLASIDRKQFPWVILLGHRPMYNTDEGEWNAHQPGARLQQEIEPLLLKYKVDLCLWGHMHMGERTFPVHSSRLANGTWIGLVDESSLSQGGHVYTNPVAATHVVQATAGVFTDSKFILPQPSWSAFRTSHWGYGRMTVHNATHLQYELRDWESASTEDYFWIVKA